MAGAKKKPNSPSTADIAGFYYSFHAQSLMIVNWWLRFALSDTSKSNIVQKLFRSFVFGFVRKLTKAFRSRQLLITREGRCKLNTLTGGGRQTVTWSMDFVSVSACLQIYFNPKQVEKIVGSGREKKLVLKNADDFNFFFFFIWLIKNEKVTNFG